MAQVLCCGGDDAADARLAQQLLDDPNETAEHVMLVDLARNDLSRRCDVVAVERFKEIQYYSHVINLVSKVVGQLGADTEPLDVVGDPWRTGDQGRAQAQARVRFRA